MSLDASTFLAPLPVALWGLGLFLVLARVQALRGGLGSVLLGAALVVPWFALGFSGAPALLEPSALAVLVVAVAFGWSYRRARRYAFAGVAVRPWHALPDLLLAVVLVLGVAVGPPDLGRGELPTAFLGVAELERIFSTPLAAALPWLALATLVALPWLTIAGETGKGDRLPSDAGLFAVGLVVLVFGLLPLVVGVVRQASQGIPVEALPLSQAFWIVALGSEVPRAWFVRELPGLLVIGLHFAVWPVVLLRWGATRGLARRYRDTLGAFRYGLLVTLVLLLLLAPLRLFAFWGLGIGEWIRLPEFGLFF